MDNGQDDSAHLENDALMPDSEGLPEDTVTNISNDDNSSAEHQETSTNANELQEVDSSTTTITDANGNTIMTDFKRTEQSSIQENLSGLMA